MYFNKDGSVKYYDRYGETNLKDVLDKTRKAFGAWRTMMLNCNDPKNSQYTGGAMEKSWEDFNTWLKYVGLPPAVGDKCRFSRDIPENGWFPGNVSWK